MLDMGSLYWQSTLRDMGGWVASDRIASCIQAAMVLEDSLLESLSYGAWKAALKPKIAGSWNLHTLLPTNIDFFILLSSIVGIVGQIGQANYGAGNTFQDALARYRVQHGLTAISIDLGVMTSVGRIADDASVAKRFIHSDNLLSLGAHELFILLGHYCKASTLKTRATASQLMVGLVKAKPGATSARLLTPPLLKYMCNPSKDTSPAKHLELPAAETDWTSLFAKAKNHIDAGAIVMKALIHKLSSTQDAIRNIDAQKPMLSYGIDSIIAVELRNWFGREFKAIVPTTEIMSGATFLSIGILVAQRSRIGK